MVTSRILCDFAQPTKAIRFEQLVAHDKTTLSQDSLCINLILLFFSFNPRTCNAKEEVPSPQTALPGDTRMFLRPSEKNHHLPSWYQTT
jgi:hypothetical protein